MTTVKEPCSRCKDTGYCGPWGDSDHDDDTPRRCNHCDYHRGNEGGNVLQWAKKAKAFDNIRAILKSQGMIEDADIAWSTLERVADVVNGVEE